MVHAYPNGAEPGLEAQDHCLFNLWKKSTSKYSYLVQRNFNAHHESRCIAFGSSLAARDGVAAEETQMTTMPTIMEVDEWIEWDKGGFLGTGWSEPFSNPASAEETNKIRNAMRRQLNDPNCQDQEYGDVRFCQLHSSGICGVVRDRDTLGVRMPVDLMERLDPQDPCEAIAVTLSVWFKQDKSCDSLPAHDVMCVFNMRNDQNEPKYRVTLFDSNGSGAREYMAVCAYTIAYVLMINGHDRKDWRINKQPEYACQLLVHNTAFAGSCTMWSELAWQVQASFDDETATNVLVGLQNLDVIQLCRFYMEKRLQIASMEATRPMMLWWSVYTKELHYNGNPSGRHAFGIRPTKRVADRALGMQFGRMKNKDPTDGLEYTLDTGKSTFILATDLAGIHVHMLSVRGEGADDNKVWDYIKSINFRVTPNIAESTPRPHDQRTDALIAAMRSALVYVQFIAGLRETSTETLTALPTTAIKHWRRNTPAGTHANHHRSRERHDEEQRRRARQRDRAPGNARERSRSPSSRRDWR